MTRARRWLRRVEVHGASMRPSLEAGDRLLVVRRRRYRPGDVVALADPRDGTRIIVKRVAEVHDGGARYTVLGDDPAASTDSRSYGPVDASTIVGRAVCRYFPDDRRGTV